MSQAKHHHEERDPIMEDEGFSLRYGNPIQIIHDTPKHTVETFEPSKEHALPSIASLQTAEPSRVTGTSSPSVRDSTCNEYFHNPQGTVTEVDHTQ
ncbi:hypothetical protein BY458DRAFT_496947 [Sporodiniella umbellata]|nr:hypothetical protein BY458DRAFT_496947 [Sporodiniella umbellata]